MTRSTIGLRIGLVMLGTLLVSSTAAQQPRSYRLDNAHSSLVFSISHAGLSYVYGRFNEITGSFQWAAENPAAGSFEFRIKVDSIDTNNAERDEHLRKPDFFDAQEFPEIALSSTSIEEVEEGLVMKARLTLHGETRPVELPLKVVGIGKGPFGKERAGFFARLVIKRSDFGMDKMQNIVGDNVSVTFSFEGILEDADQ